MKKLLVKIWRLAAKLLSRVLDARRDDEIATQNLGRILWVRLDHIGDVTMSLPALGALRRRYPDAQIDALVRPACAPLLRDLSIINRVLTYDSPRFPQRKNTRGAGLWRTLFFIGRLRRQNYDIAIDVRGDDIARLLIYFARVPLRLGFDRAFYEAPDAPNLKFLLTDAVEFPCEPRHAVRNNLELMRVLDLPQNEEEIAPQTHPLRELLTDENASRVAAKLQKLGASQNFIVIHINANDAARNWQIEKWAQVADELVESQGAVILLSGAPSDYAANEKLKTQMQDAERVINAAGVFSLQELPSFFSRAKLFLTVDTGPMHIAAAVGTPVVALFLSHLAPRHAPWGQEESVVCGDETLDEISVGDVGSRFRVQSSK
jgi:ADP-heptose:LPS heptosyltransferase